MLALTVDEEVLSLKDMDRKAYALGVMSAIEKDWRSKALRLHPDKIDGAFWSQDRKERLGRVFYYYSTAQEELMKAFAQYVIPMVNNACVSYFLTDTAQLGVEITWDASDNFSTCIQYVDYEGASCELLVDEGRGKHIFTDEDAMCECMFEKGFRGYSLFHVGPVGRLRYVESEEMLLITEVPRELLDARALLVQHARAAEGNKRRRTCAYVPDKPVAPWRSSHRRTRQQHHRKQVCLYHDPAQGWFCRYYSCNLCHIDTRTKKGAKRWTRIMSAMARARRRA